MFLSKYETMLYAVLRIAAGFLFLWHGSQKLLDYPPAGVPIPLHVVVIGGTVEFVGGIMILIGFFTSWAAFFACGEMAYAYWTVHAPAALLPLVNQGEMAVLYCFLFLYFAARGSGVFSVDHFLAARHK